MQVGDRHHHPGKSHIRECGGYPPWGDDANNRTYGEPSWNYVVLYKREGTTSGVSKLPIRGATASSEHPGGYGAANAINGRMGQDGGADWSTRGEGAGAWIELDLGAPMTVTLLKFAGRVRDDKFRQVRVSFSDDSHQDIELKNTARLEEYTLAPTRTTFVRITCVSCWNTSVPNLSLIHI